MGNGYFDVWTFAHFLGGVAYRLVIFPNNSIVSFTLSTFVHLLGELAEQPKHAITKAIEDPRNHAGDMFAFMFGWVAGCYVNPYIAPYRVPLMKNPRFWLLIIAMTITIKEFLREIINTHNGVLRKMLY